MVRQIRLSPRPSTARSVPRVYTSSYTIIPPTAFGIFTASRMLLILVLAVSSLSVLEARASVDSSPRSQVLRYEMDTAKMPNSYRYHYDTSDGSSRTEQGAYSSTGNSPPALKVNGAVRWYNEKGHLYEMTYKAGRRGFRTIIKRVRE